MKKVICIDGVKEGAKAKLNDERAAKIEQGEEIFEGRQYTIIGEREYPDGVFYVLLEKPFHMSYADRRFALISSIDETCFVRDYNKETV